MKKTSFGESHLIDCDFKETLLEKSDFRRCDLKGTLFHQCSLKEADFRCASHYDIDPLSNDIQKGKFSTLDALSLLKGFQITLE